MAVLDSLRRLNHRFRVDSGPGCFPTDAWTDPAYEQWFHAHRVQPCELARQRESHFEYRPKFSIIVPLYKTPIDYLTTMVESVLAQSYDNLELLLVNASPEDSDLAAAVEAIVDFDDRVIEVRLEGNRGITENTNCGIDAAAGDFLCFLDHDDFLEPDLLYEYARALNEQPDIDMLYCDEDMVEVDGGRVRHVHPIFKPAYSPEFFLCKNYVLHLLTVRADVARSIERPDSRYDGTQDYNMALRVAKRARRVHGVQKVLYHWRISEQSTATNPDAKPYSKRAYRESAFARMSELLPTARMALSGIPNIHELWFDVVDGPRVSIVVDCAEAPDSLDAFIEAFDQASSYVDCEIVPVSGESGPFSFEADSRVASPVVCAGNRYARLNAGAHAASGDYILFLSSADVFATPMALSQLTGLCEGDGIGAVAAKCLYSDYSVMNYGIAVTPERIMPLYRGYPDDFPAYQCNTRAIQNVSAVSWRGMMVSRALFQELGGFDTRYEGEIGSADFCQKVLNAGLRVAQIPTAEIQTGEAAPEKRYDCMANAEEFTRGDTGLFDSLWPGVRQAGDPYFNRNLDQSSEYFQIAGTRHVPRKR